MKLEDLPLDPDRPVWRGEKTDTRSISSFTTERYQFTRASVDFFAVHRFKKESPRKRIRPYKPRKPRLQVPDYPCAHCGKLLSDRTGRRRVHPECRDEWRRLIEKKRRRQRRRKPDPRVAQAVNQRFEDMIRTELIAHYRATGTAR